MKHRGEILEHAIRKSGFKISTIATRLKVDRQTLYNWFDQANLPVERMLNVGKIIGYDFHEDLPELLKPYAKMVEIQPDEWKDKYILLLEEHNRLLMDKITGAELVAQSVQSVAMAIEKIQSTLVSKSKPFGTPILNPEQEPRGRTFGEELKQRKKKS